MAVLLARSVEFGFRVTYLVNNEIIGTSYQSVHVDGVAIILIIHLLSSRLLLFYQKGRC